MIDVVQLKKEKREATLQICISLRKLGMAVSNIIGQEIEKEADPLLELSRKLWLCPETKYEEIFAHDALTEFLERNGFTVSRRYKLDTAFRAVYKQGQGSPHVVVICEYDALPEIGHACGHNLIAEVGKTV